MTYEAFVQRLTSLIIETARPIDAAVVNRLLATDNATTQISLDKRQSTIITVIKGYGGHEAIDAKLPELRRALPEAFIISLGPINDDLRNFVDIAAHVDDVTPFIAHSNWLLMACGLNGIAQAYPYATLLVVLPDNRPHQEQEVMAEALIAHGRALSWEQFMGQIVEGKIQDIPLAYENHEDNNKKNKCDHISHSPAQTFMNSIITYSSTKLWFEEWLLPQLGLSPDI